MSIVFKKVVLKNIRSHADYTFEPLARGVTAISGPNGAGKSTIVDSITWALYGTKPQGVSKAKDLARTGTALGTDDCFVRVFFSVDGNDAVVDRRIVTKGGAVECSWFDVVTDADGTVREELKAGPAVSHAEPYVVQRLGMEEKHFLSAVLVQQKQVDQFITAGPKERTQVIERMTGIDTITLALTDARQELNSLRKLSAHLPDGAGEIENMTASLDELTAELCEVKAKGKAVVAEVKESKERFKRDKTALTEYKKGVREKERLGQTIASLTARARDLDGYLRSLKEDLSHAGASSNPNKLTADYDALSAKVAEAEAEYETLKKQHDDIHARLERSESELRTMRGKTSDNELTKEELGREIKRLESEGRKAEKKMSRIREKQASVRAAVAQTKAAKEALSEGKGHCPTCLQSVSDLSAVFRSFDRQCEKYENKLASLESELTSTDDVIQETSRKKTVACEVYDAVSAIPEFEKEVGEFKEALKALVPELKASSVSLKALRKKLSKLEVVRERQNEYKKLRDKASEYMKQQNELYGELNEAKEKYTVFEKYSPAKMEKSEKKLKETEAHVYKCKQNAIELKGEYKLLSERIVRLTEDISKAREAKEGYERVLSDVETTANSVDVIQEFKDYRIENSIPVLKRYASEFLSRFTGGAFIGLDLDSKFNAEVVLSDGTKRAVGLLSGGEVSAAALALRLAIAVMSSNETGGSIILDEVLVSQDTLRAETILSVVSDVCQGQVIIIAHNDMIESVADKVVSIDGGEH